MTNYLEKRKLIESLEYGKGIQYIIDSALEILGNPLIINDVSYRLLAYSDNRVLDDPLWNELISLGTFSHSTVNFFRDETFIDEVANSDTLSLLRSDKLKYDRINGKIFDRNDIHIGNICVVACYQAFEPDDYLLIDELCAALGEELQRSEFYQTAELVYQETYITKLIDGQKTDGAYDRNQLETLKGELKPNLFAAVVDITQYDQSLIHLGYFRDIFRSLQSEYKYYIYTNNIVIIIHLDGARLDIERDMGKLGEFFKNNNIYAGISAMFHDVLELQKYFRQAIHALNYGVLANNSEHIFVYDDFRIDHVLSIIKDHVAVEDICNPIVPALVEYDREHNTEYSDILYTFLLRGRNIELTAKQLGITVTELQGHLRRIDNIYGMDWDNGNRTLSIFLSLKFLRDIED